MKFQKDNTKIALTEEMKQQEVREKREKIVREKAQKETVARLEKEVWKLKDEYQKVTDSLLARQMSYLPVDLQLDMLWHDMESGAIKVDKRRANTWYKHIKSVKESYPISENWRDELGEIQSDLNQLMANNKIEVV